MCGIGEAYGARDWEKRGCEDTLSLVVMGVDVGTGSVSAIITAAKGVFNNYDLGGLGAKREAGHPACKAWD